MGSRHADGAQAAPRRLKAEYAELYKGKLEIGREYHALFFSYPPEFMSIMGTTVDRAGKRHFEIVTRDLPTS
jgi:hypothetical protein